MKAVWQMRLWNDSSVTVRPWTSSDNWLSLHNSSLITASFIPKASSGGRGDVGLESQHIFSHLVEAKPNRRHYDLVCGAAVAYSSGTQHDDEGDGTFKSSYATKLGKKYVFTGECSNQNQIWCANLLRGYPGFYRFPTAKMIPH